MTAAVWWTFGTTLGIVSPWLYWRYRRNALAKRVVKPVTELENPYLAIEIHTGWMPCDAVLELAAQRFLVAEAPQLPLPQCDKGECRCRHVSHDDRRSSEDRRNPFDRYADFNNKSVEDKRRSTRERRRSNRPGEARSYYNDY